MTSIVYPKFQADVDKSMRRAIALVFREARQYVWDGRSKDIAGRYYTLTRAIYDVHLPLTVRLQAIDIVHARTGRHHQSDLRGWLEAQGIVTVIGADDEFVQTHRLQWLEMLEKEFSK